MSAGRVLSAFSGASFAVIAFQSATLLKSPLPWPNLIPGIRLCCDFRIAFTGIALLGGTTLASTGGGLKLAGFAVASEGGALNVASFVANVLACQAAFPCTFGSSFGVGEDVAFRV